MMAVIEEVLRPPQPHCFRNAAANWYSFILALYRLQRFNEANKIKNFTIIPQFQAGRKNIRIDMESMERLINSLPSTPEANKFKSGTIHYVGAWAPFIDYLRFETANHYFDYDIITDAISASVQMVRERVPKKKQMHKRRRWRWLH